MKPTSKTTPPDPLDELLAGALLGDLTPEERAELDARLARDPAARAAYQETQHMHDLLEKNYREAQPNPAFEQRMIAGVRRKLQDEKQHRETAWGSLVALWRGVKGVLSNRWVTRGAFAGVFLLIAGLSVQSYFSHLPLITAMGQERINIPVPASSRAFADNSSDSNEQPAMPAPAAATPKAPTGDSEDAAMPMLRPIHAPMAQPQGQTVPVASDLNVYSGKPVTLSAPQVTTQNGTIKSIDSVREFPYAQPATVPGNSSPTATTPAPEPTRKLIRNARLDLEVKSFQDTVDRITTLVNGAGGYVDCSDSQRGGNGKLQGTVVVKVLPENLDAFLLKLRDLGEIRNQSVSTEDITRAYYDTQARLDNSRRMETQLQALLQHDNGKVSELLQVERELGRVRGEIEQMQGELKLYDFQVRYATVTIAVQEKDLNQAAAYLLKENDQFSLFARDVEAAFRQARQASDDFKGNILNASLDHNSGSDISATLVVSVPPEQIEGFLARVRTLGRIDNFTRTTERVARDGGDTDQPADETRTEKDRVTVNLTIRSDDETPRQQTQVSIVTSGGVDAQAQALKQQAAANGVDVTASSFERESDGREMAQMTFRLPMAKVPSFMETLKKLGRVKSLAVHRDDRPGAAPADENAPAEISLQLHNETAIVAEDNGLWVTLRRTFGEGIAAFLGSVQTIGVVVAFLLPWLVALVIVAWIGRRVYVARRKL